MSNSTINIEFKAKTNQLAQLEQKLQTLQPTFIGIDCQKDTYFNIAQNGRLKLREGNIENALIYYQRPNTANAKQANVLMYQHAPSEQLKSLLVAAHGIKIVVEKVRKIYFIDNVKFHFDTLTNLGTFVEVEAIDNTGSIGIEALQKQCNYYASFFEIDSKDFQSLSYSDMLLQMS